MAGSVYDISSYGVDYPIETLVVLMERGDLVVPDFQRNYVWSISQASRFVESCIANLPIPTIFFFKTEDSKFLIVDGLQRLQTVRFFREGKFGRTGRPFVLTGLGNDNLNGKTYETLSGDMRRRFDQAVLRATVFTQNKPEKGMQSVYEVFSRLNSGGTKLASHEVRNAIMRGDLNKILEDFNSNDNWRVLYGKNMPDIHRKDEEAILRFLALFESADNYTAPMNGFLNQFMDSRLNPGEAWMEKHKELFFAAVDHVRKALGKDAFRTKLGAQINVAIADSLIVSFMKNIERIRSWDDSQRDRFRHRVKTLKESSDYLDAVEKNTSDTKRVKLRMRLVQGVIDEI